MDVQVEADLEVAEWIQGRLPRELLLSKPDLIMAEDGLVQQVGLVGSEKELPFGLLVLYEFGNQFLQQIGVNALINLVYNDGGREMDSLEDGGYQLQP